MGVLVKLCQSPVSIKNGARILAGKERAYLGIATALKWKVWANPSKLRVCPTMYFECMPVVVRAWMHGFCITLRHGTAEVAHLLLITLVTDAYSHGPSLPPHPLSPLSLHSQAYI